MKVTEKTTSWLTWLAVLTLLLGIGIQIWLASARSVRNLNQSHVLSGQLAATALDSAGERASRLRLDTAALAALPEKKAANYRDLHLELLILVNAWNPVPEDYSVELTPIAEWQIGEDQQIDVRCADALLQMIHDCQEAGNHPYICSSYRTYEMQELLYYNKIGRVMEWGYNWEVAAQVASQSVAVPGTSEHQLGLAADIIDDDYTYLDEGQEQTSTQRWLMENSWKYGFILRYPNGTTDITGIIYEPWHYRYVGEHFAKEIHELGVTLEEYIALRRGR